MAEPFLGEIKMFGFNFPPRGWAECNGQLLAISQNSALFSLLGTIYGGDGRTDFALPEMRGRVPTHRGTGPGLDPRTIGQGGGDETNTLSVSNIPAHNHDVTMQVQAALPNSFNPTNRSLATAPDFNGTPARMWTNETTSPRTITGLSSSNTGNGSEFSILQPYRVVNFCIALVGLFPSRS